MGHKISTLRGVVTVTFVCASMFHHQMFQDSTAEQVDTVEVSSSHSRELMAGMPIAPAIAALLATANLQQDSQDQHLIHQGTSPGAITEFDDEAFLEFPEYRGEVGKKGNAETNQEKRASGASLSQEIERLRRHFETPEWKAREAELKSHFHTPEWKARQRHVDTPKWRTFADKKREFMGR